MWSQGGLARPYAEFPSEEDTPFPPSPSSSPEPLWSLSREGAGAELWQALLVLCFLRTLESRPGGVAVPSEARQEATDRIPGPTPLLGGGLASQLPFHLAPVGGFSGSSCGAEKGENGAHPQLFPAWLTLGKQREVGGPCAGGEVLCERHYRS